MGEYRTEAERAGLSADHTLIERLDAWAARRPDRVCLERVDVGRGEALSAAPFSVEQLLAGARAVAAHLVDRGVGSGDRVLLCLPNTELFVEHFLGAHWIGAVPVPLPSLAGFGGKAALVERVRGVVTDCRPRLLLGDTPTVRGIGEVGCEVVDAQAVRHQEASGRSAGARYAAGPEETAFIQYTSGSTGTPRGVLVTHANLRANLVAAERQMRMTAADRFFTWLPLYHDMGLIGTLLIPLYAGHTSVLMSPLSFLLRPARWIRALSKFEATLCAAPNFAYALALRKVKDEDLAGVDLSRLRIAHNGAEPVDPVTARGFIERYRRHGLPEHAFYPVYGLAEATLSVAFPDPGDPLFVDTVDRAQLVRGHAAPLAEGASSGAAPASSFVSVGRAVPGHVVEIRDPDSDEVLPERRLGEIVVHGPSVTPGYFTLDSAPREPRRFLRTGDLGYLAGGRLYVVDRIKDLIIAEGRNITPSDLERSLAIEGVRAGRVVSFGVPDLEGGTERVVVVAETNETRAVQLGLIADHLRQVVRSEHALALSDVVLVEPGTLPRTSSGKVMRRRTREIYLAKQLVPAGTTPPVVKLWKKAKGRVTVLVQALLSRLPG